MQKLKFDSQACTLASLSGTPLLGFDLIASPDINKGVSVRADQQLRGSSRGPDWGLSSEGKDLTQKTDIKYARERKGDGHGQRIRDRRGEMMTSKTAEMTKLEVGDRNVPASQFHISPYFASKPA